MKSETILKEILKIRKWMILIILIILVVATIFRQMPFLRTLMDSGPSDDPRRLQRRTPRGRSFDDLSMSSRCITSVMTFQLEEISELELELELGDSPLVLGGSLLALSGSQPALFSSVSGLWT